MASERLQRQVDRLLDEAEAAITELNWGLVRDRALAVLGIDPENNEGRAFLATAERALLGSTETPTQPAPPISPISADQPTSFANGRYEVKKFLGEGGKKKVYLAKDNVLDRDVAFALIKTEGLDAVSRERITREAQAMGRLGSHPNIVTVLDLGDHAGQPYMVIELLAGGDVEGVIEKAPDHKLPLDQAVRIAVETCRGLEFAHSRNIVHRDLKPGNVWLTAGGTAKIGDFGLAVATDRSRLTQEGMMVGTVSYMPPEQAMGGEVTPRADLYSLGAMLYEMVTGRPPFLGDESVAIIGQHINTPPVAPTWHNPQCPRPLEALILRLLAKDPKERPGSATDVLTVLNGIDTTANAADLRAVDEARALDSLAGGVFVGRQREMGELKAALEDALSGRGRLVMLIGEPGIGKTRTALELSTYAGLRKAQVLWGRCYEGAGAPPYWPWVQAIRSYVRDQDAEKLQSEMGSGGADIAEIVSDVRERLPDLKSPPALEPEQARFRLFDSITTFLKSAGRRQPLVLILDDLHWSDKASLLLLEFVAAELAGSRLLVIGTYRDMEVSRQHPLSQTLGQLTRQELFQRVLLRGLAQEDVGRFIEMVGGIKPPHDLVATVYRQTEGNPLFVTEVVRLLVQEGELTREKTKDSGTWSVRIPEGVREVIGRRLDRLSERCNQTLTIAAVIGRQFSLKQLDRLIEDMSGDRLLEVLEEALAARVIEELPRTLGHYQFTHALIQETLSDELSTTRRIQLHARIGKALEDLYGSDVEAHAAELAHHYSEALTVTGGDKLVRYSLLAGERALAAHAYEEAVGYFERALAAKEGQPMDAETATLLFGLGRAQVATLETDRMTEALSSFRRAFDYFAEIGDIRRAVSVAEYPLPLYLVVGHRNGLADLTGRALALVPADSKEAGRLLCRYGFSLYMEEGDYQRAEAAFDRSLAIAQREEDTAIEMQTLNTSANVEIFYVRPREAVEKSLRAIELARSVGDLRMQVYGGYFAAASLSFLGDLERAQPQAEALVRAAETLRDRFWLAGAFWMIERVHRLKGEWQAARAWLDRGLALSPRDFRPLCSRAVLEFELGEFSQGEVFLDRLLEVVRFTEREPTTERAMAAHTMGVVARITGGSGYHDGIQITTELAEGVVASPSATRLVDLYARCGLSLLAVQQGDVSAAEEHYAVLQQYPNVLGIFLTGHRILGLLAGTLGRMDRAMGHFEDGLAFCRKAGCRPELAWTCSDYAGSLLQRKNPGDREKAMKLLDEGLAISSELGMRPLMERILARKEILKA